MKKFFCLLLTMLLLFCSAAPVFAIKTEADIFPFNGEDTFFSIQGATLIGDGQYSFTEEALFSIDQPVTGDWNQYKLTYSSTQPLSGVIQYQTDGQEKEEIFYLEAGENKTFSSYIDGYLESKTAQQLLSLSFTSIKGEEADFTFLSLDTQKETVYEDEVLYLENQRFKVGVNLQWGGGLSYFEDKQCAVEGLENMLNHHDTGRLVQQSYYGISSAPYENGNYNGAVWPYNPVQGGDLYGNASKIVEIRVTENQIYIKSLPLDWAKDNVPTQCYMENTYTLEENQLRVDNRFVDFSNYIHPQSQQELPAFYVVSYLDQFTYYAGEKPWTGDGLTTLDDLPFWGDAEFLGDTSFAFSSQNTETWCAWTDTEGYGIGLYVPNVTALKAGRYEYNQTKSDTGNPTNYVAPLRSIRLSSFQPLEYSYLITAGQLEEIRAQFTQEKDFTQNESLAQDPCAGMDFTHLTFDENEDFLAFAQNNETEVEQADGAALLTASNLVANDPYVTFQFPSTQQLLGEDYPYVVVTLMAPSSNGKDAYQAEMFAGAGNQISPEAGKSQVFTFSADSTYHGQIVSFLDRDYWQGDIRFLRLDYFTSAVEGDQLYLYSIRLAKTLEEAETIAQQEAEAANQTIPQELLEEAPAPQPEVEEDPSWLVWIWFTVGPTLLMCVGMIVITKIKRR